MKINSTEAKNLTVRKSEEMSSTKFAYMPVQKNGILLNATFKCSLLLLVSYFPYVENNHIKLLITIFTRLVNFKIKWKKFMQYSWLVYNNYYK